MRITRANRRRALSLIELVVSMTAASMLLAGTTSTIYVVVRASDPKYAPSVALLDGSRCAADLVADLGYALSITAATSTSVTATVPDRNADGSPETIRYAWAGAGQALTREYNGSSASAVLPSVQSFAIEYQPSSVAPTWLVLRIQSSTLSTSAVETYVRLYNLQ
jgi:Tfp pilus assembly protein PilW